MSGTARGKAARLGDDLVSAFSGFADSQHYLMAKISGKRNPEGK